MPSDPRRVIIQKTNKIFQIPEGDFFEDGTKTVCEYDDTFTLINETTYDASGTPI